MPPTNIRFGISVPYLGAASGASSAPAGCPVGGGAAAILCISAGVVSRRKLAAPKGRILRLLLVRGVRAGRKKLVRCSLLAAGSRFSLINLLIGVSWFAVSVRIGSGSDRIGSDGWLLGG